jgi:hypothetical protein
MPRAAAALARWPRAALVALVAASQLVAHAPATTAQEEGGVGLEIMAQPAWRRTPEQRLRLRLRISNETSQDLAGLQVRLSVGDRIGSRSALHDSYREGFFQESAYTPIEGLSIPAGESRRPPINDRLERLDTIARAEDNGVYPLAILVSDRLGEPLAEATTPLVYYPGRVDTELNLVLVLPLGDRPARGPDGTFPVDPVTERWPLEEAVSRSGWLRGIVDALARNTQARPPLRLAAAPVPRLVDELADLADGYVRSTTDGTERVPASAPPARRADELLRDLRRVLRRGATQILFVPYGAPDLPAISRELDVEGNLSDHFDDGREALEEALGTDVSARADTRWVYPPAGRVDMPSLEDLQTVSAGEPGPLRLFLSPESLEEAPTPEAAGCPRELLTFSCPVELESPRPARGLIADPALQERLADLAAPGNNALDLQRLVAETAMIREELPGVSGRVVEAIVPSVWHPSRRVIGQLLGRLRRAPWLDAITPRAALARAETAVRAPVEAAASVRGEPPSGLYQEIAAAHTIVERFSQIKPRPSLLRRLRRNLLAAQARAWWVERDGSETAAEYASETEASAQGQLDNISIGGRSVITLTSSRQPLPLLLFNGNSYPVKVDLHLVAPGGQLEFDDPVLQQRLRQGNNPVTVSATARSSGSFPLTVCVTAPNEGCDEAIVTQDMRITSTQFNKIALGVTFGALAFLVLFYAVHVGRSRRGSRDTPGPTSA